jgi:predicted Zn-dependent protease
VTELSAIAQVQAALDRGDLSGVLERTEPLLAERPGNDAAHELRARALLALGRLDEAERHANDAVRIDPEEIRYRELLAEVLAAHGAHREAAAEFGHLARSDPRSAHWVLAEAREHLSAAQPELGVEAARRAVRLDPRNGVAQLALSQALARTGNAAGSLAAALRASALLPGDRAAREALADARWLAGERAAAFSELRALAVELGGPGQAADRRRIEEKVLVLYGQHARGLSRLLLHWPALLRVVLRIGWIGVR